MLLRLRTTLAFLASSSTALRLARLRHQKRTPVATKLWRLFRMVVHSFRFLRTNTTHPRSATSVLTLASPLTTRLATFRFSRFVLAQRRSISSCAQSKVLRTVLLECSVSTRTRLSRARRSRQLLRQAHTSLSIQRRLRSHPSAPSFGLVTQAQVPLSTNRCFNT